MKKKENRIIGIDKVDWAAKKRASSYVIGIDEVGRGALAGPVVVCATLLRGVIPTSGLRSRYYGGTGTGNARIKISTSGKLRDSKELSAKQREKWFSYFKSCPAIEFAVARVYPRQIEKMNISRAANVAALRAYKKLSAHSTELADRKIADVQIFLDGGLFLGNTIQPKNATTVIKADEKFPAVAIASIVAKVHRDRFMVRLGKKHPEYGFAAHKGYGTKAHYKALKKYGSCKVHRETFLHDPRIASH